MFETITKTATDISIQSSQTVRKMDSIGKTVRCLLCTSRSLSSKDSTEQNQIQLNISNIN